MSVLIGYIRSTSSTSSQPPPAGCKAARKVCVSFSLFCPPSPSPKSQVPSPKSNPPAEPQLLHSGVATCIGRRIQLSRPAALLQDPLAPLPPPPCIRTPLAVLYCAAQQVLVAQYTGPGFSQSSPVSQSATQSVCLAGGSRRSSCWLSEVPRGPGQVCLSALLPRPRVQAQNTCSRALWLPEARALDLTSLGPATQCPFRHPRCCLFQPAHSRPVPSLS